ncbi:hypothetical protein AB0A63_10460 [Lentzea sp. NPDC042327]|uniref:hypothetical protein n=1 Tax=Lentzea sp. NPDC042327 TaxID=3154801 RepID=UPI0033C86A03
MVLAEGRKAPTAKVGIPFFMADGYLRQQVVIRPFGMASHRTSHGRSSVGGRPVSSRS